MSSREFVDEDGITWRVWRTVPGGAKVLDDHYARGWLTFESEGSRRRLVPVPTDWHTASASRLSLYCRRATAVPRHMGAFAARGLDGGRRDDRAAR